MNTDCNYEFIRHLKGIVDKRARKYLIKSMAEMCEKAYRRGVQQALHFERNYPHEMTKRFKSDEQITDWRYSNNNKSIGIDGYATSIKERFLIQNNLWMSFDD